MTVQSHSPVILVSGELVVDESRPPSFAVPERPVISCGCSAELQYHCGRSLRRRALGDGMELLELCMTAERACSRRDGVHALADSSSVSRSQ